MRRGTRHFLALTALILTLGYISVAERRGLSQGPLPRIAPTLAPPPGPPRPGTGFMSPSLDLSHLTGQRMPQTFLTQAPLPDRWDWREQGKVTSVKNQGECGSCYAFASIRNIESKLLVDGAGSYDLSENNAKECNWRELNDFEDPPGYPWGSCDRGNYGMLASLFSQMGTVLESCDPYFPSDVECRTTCPYQNTLLDWRIISGNSVPATGVLKSYLRSYGPIHTSMYVWAGAPDFYGYDGSYTLYRYVPPGVGTNHAVLIVGWDDTLVRTGGTGGWIVKNSWGTDWGGTCGFGTQGGYFTIAYGSANIGMESSFMHDWQEYDNRGGIMYYDEGGWTGSLGYVGTTTAWALVKFIPDRNTQATRVEFWTTDATTDVDVEIYNNFDGSAYSQLLAQKLNNSFSEAGYHSVALASPLAVTTGDDVIVVMKFTNASYKYPIAYDDEGPVQTGRTYISPPGESHSWTDLGTHGSGNVAIRLRTSQTGGPLTPTPTSTSTPTATPTPTSTPTPIPAPNVGVDKAVVGSNFQPGHVITFTLAIANTGNKIASAVIVTDILPIALVPPSVGVDSSLAITLTGIPPSYVWSVEPLGVAESGVITIAGVIKPDWPPESAIVNRASISDPEDSTPHNNTDVVIVNGYPIYLPVLVKS